MHLYGTFVKQTWKLKKRFKIKFEKVHQVLFLATVLKWTSKGLVELQHEGVKVSLSIIIHKSKGCVFEHCMPTESCALQCNKAINRVIVYFALNCIIVYIMHIMLYWKRL